MKIFSIISVTLSCLLTTISYGQQTVKTKESKKKQENKIKTEQQYIAQAKENIEKYRKGNGRVVVVDTSGKEIENVSVIVNQISQDFLFGNLCEEVFRPGISHLDATKFKEAFMGLFNFTELTVKWAPYEKEQGKTQWQALQEKLDWCRQNGVTPKGHTLAWTNMAGTPSWLLKLPIETATDLHKARIQNLVGGFKDQIKMWDVVNEPVTTIPWEKALLDSVSGNLIDEGTRYNVTGITQEQTLPWVERAFQWAHEMDNKGDFMINEFYVIAKPDVREKYYQLIKELQKRGTLVTGVGIQAHEPRDMWFSPEETVKTFDRMKELGLPLHITEFTPQSSGKNITGGWRQGTWTEEAQADFAEQFYILAYGHPAIASIHWWGLSDRYIWLKGGGLLDEDFNPKPVYNRLKKLIKEEWMTKNINLVSGKGGIAGFRGFYGKYNVEIVTKDGSRQSMTFHLKENTESKWTFILK